MAEAAPVGFDCARGSLKAERALARIAIVAIDAMASILARHIKAVIDTVTTKFARPAYRATARVRRHAIHTRSPICTVMAETILNIFGAVIPLPAPITRTGVVVHEINADPVDARQRRTLIHVCLAVLSDKARDALACVGDKTVLAGAVSAAELAGASVNLAAALVSICDAVTRSTSTVQISCDPIRFWFVADETGFKSSAFGIWLCAFI